MTTAVMPILVSTLGTVVGKYFQDRNESMKRRRERLQEIVPKVNESMKSVGARIDMLSFFADEALYSIVFRNEVYKNKKSNDDVNDSKVTAWGSFSDALVEWQKFRTITVAEVKQYFGDEAFNVVKDIQELVDKISDLLHAAYYERTNSSSYIENKKGTPNDFRTKYFEPKKLLDKKIEQLNMIMVETADSLHDQL